MEAWLAAPLPLAAGSACARARRPFALPPKPNTGRIQAEWSREQTGASLSPSFATDCQPDFGPRQLASLRRILSLRRCLPAA